MLPMAQRRRQKFSEQLRAAVKADERTPYRISKQTGIPRETLSRFLHNEAGMLMPTLDMLIEALDLELVKREPNRKT